MHANRLWLVHAYGQLQLARDLGSSCLCCGEILELSFLASYCEGVQERGVSRILGEDIVFTILWENIL